MLVYGYEHNILAEINMKKENYIAHRSIKYKKYSGFFNFRWFFEKKNKLFEFSRLLLLYDIVPQISRKLFW